MNFIKIEEHQPSNTPLIKIFSDGACKGNPGPSGSGLALYGADPLPLLYFGDFNPRGTNNSAELLALLSALKLASIEVNAKSRVEILSDSKYSIDCITKWAHGWQKKGWKKPGGEIKNLDIIQEAFSLYNTLKHSVSISYVKAHCGIEGNELADRAAGLAITHKSSGYSRHPFHSVRDVLAL